MAPKPTGKAKAQAKAKTSVAAHVGPEVEVLFTVQACYFVLTRFSGVKGLGFDGEDINTFVWSFINATVRKGITVPKFTTLVQNKGFDKYKPAVDQKIKDFDGLSGGKLAKYADGWANTMKSLRNEGGGSNVQLCVGEGEVIKQTLPAGKGKLTVEDFYAVSTCVQPNSPLVLAFAKALNANFGDSYQDLIRSVMSVYWQVLFFFADKNNDGGVDQKEFEEATGLDKATVAGLFQMMDTDKDGKLDINELAAAGVHHECRLLPERCVMQ